MRNIYLAGKIDKNDWRHSIVDGLREAIFEPPCTTGEVPQDTWPILENSINPEEWSTEDVTVTEPYSLGSFNYVGPFFVGCDHGCFHGDNQHGYIDRINFHTGKYKSRPTATYYQSMVVNLCKQAIEKADIVFAWIDRPDAYGTIAEIGYSVALGKPTFVSGPEMFDDLWFAYKLVGGFWGLYRDSQNALKSVLWHYIIDQTDFDSTLEICESPIEKLFFTAASESSAFYYQLIPQYQIDRYRVDFAIPEFEIAIELDGHEYHKTKEQRTNDASRERYLESLGWRVIRFTGSEVYKDSQACVEEAIKLINSWTGIDQR